METLISIVVPVYKVEKYIRKCIDSILGQTYRNLEVILVDDGSPDRCGDICDSYLKIDDRVKVIHKKNGGLSDARNKGLEIATGEYISFVDSDDWLNPIFCEHGLELIKQHNADIYACSLQKVWENENKIDTNHSYKMELYSAADAIYNMFNPKGIPWCAQAKIYKREFFDNIRYPIGKLMEDKATTYKLFDKACTICYEDNPLYMYLIRKGSIIHSDFSDKKLDTWIIQKNLNAFIEKNYSNAINVAKAHSVKICINLLCQMNFYNFTNQDIQEELYAYLMNNKETFISCEFVDAKYKTIYYAFAFLRRLFGNQVYRNKMFGLLSNSVAKRLIAG